MKRFIRILRVLIIIVMAALSACAGVYILSERDVISDDCLSALTSLMRTQQGDEQTADLPPAPAEASPTDVQPWVQPLPDVIGLDIQARARLESIAAEYDCAGVQVAVIDDGYVTEVCSFGYADFASDRLMNDDTKIRIASLSKVLIGMAAMRAHQDGELDIDGSLTDQLGYRVGNPSYTSHVTTLRDILTHTATFNDTASIIGRSLQNYIQDRNSYFFSARPGTPESWAYSNGGIRVAGGIVEVLTDTTMHDYTDEIFFDPLGIDASFYARLLDDTDNIATLYYGNKTVSNSVQKQLLRQNYDIPAANCSVFAGGLTISAQDYARLICILLRNGEYDGEQFLLPESVEDMQQVRFELSQFDQCTVLRHLDGLYGRELYFHTGVAYGVLSFAAYDEQANEGIVIITNGAYRTSRDDHGVPKVCADMAQYLFDEVLDGENTAHP